MRPTVAIVGGGYGGIAVASELDDIADVIVIEPRDTFVHNVAALRGLVDPEWIDRIFLPYDRLLQHGKVIRERATHVDSTTVTLSSGTRISPDYIVLATGSTYPFPAKADSDEHAVTGTRYRAVHQALAMSERVLLLGAGPVALELAGEIKAAWADKSVTIAGSASDILPGEYPDAFRAELRRQLEAMDVELVLGVSANPLPRSAPGESQTFTTTLSSGRRLTADIWFRCFGTEPVTGYLGSDLATARHADGRVAVTRELRLPGQKHVFAVGDLSDVPEAKQAGMAESHAAVVAANIRVLIKGGTELTEYVPGPSGIVLPLGPKGGATYAPGWDQILDADSVSQLRQRAADRDDGLLDLDILDAEATMQIKSADLMVDWYAYVLGQRELGTT